MPTVAYGTGRQALLEAAIRVVAQQGLRGLTYRTVAAEAGVSHGSVRYHFGDWAAMVEAALALAVERSIEGARLDSDPRFGSDVADQFAGFAAALVHAVSADPETQSFQYELALEARRRPELLPMMERVYDSYRIAVGAALRHHQLDDPGMADAVAAALDGLVFQQILFGDATRTERALGALRGSIAAFATSRGTGSSASSPST